MKVQKAVLKETGHIAIGVLIADVIMCIVFALLKKFDYTVVLGRAGSEQVSPWRTSFSSA